MMNGVLSWNDIFCRRVWLGHRYFGQFWPAQSGPNGNISAQLMELFSRRALSRECIDFNHETEWMTGMRIYVMQLDWWADYLPDFCFHQNPDVAKEFGQFSRDRFDSANSICFCRPQLRGIQSQTAFCFDLFLLMSDATVRIVSISIHMHQLASFWTILFSFPLLWLGSHFAWSFCFLIIQRASIPFAWLRVSCLGLIVSNIVWHSLFRFGSFCSRLEAFNFALILMAFFCPGPLGSDACH